jgi:hypothetical protein
MAPRKQTAFRLEPELMDALHALKVRDGVPISESVRRALWAWVEGKEIIRTTARKRGGTRKGHKGIR